MRSEERDIVDVETRDEILEAIWNSGESGDHSLPSIRGHCDVDFGDAELGALQRAGLIVWSHQTVALSAVGLKEAARVIRRHRLADSLLSTFLRLKRAHVAELACRLEHTLLPEVEEAICTLLGHPAVSPDGKPIPDGPCCSLDQRTVSRIVTRLSELRPGERGRVTYIRPDSHAHLHQLLSFGLSPGVELVVHSTTPTVCVRFESTELAMDDEIAGCIFVVRMSGCGEAEVASAAGGRAST
ncbi:MAG: metal-dependent transcriptional regulator [Deltaproteobacteria bacterium]|nr:metal-dependent transcriptional regulator [Deltaproteobacteria bacterium]